METIVQADAAALVNLLVDGPAHTYRVIRRVAESSGGVIKLKNWAVSRALRKRERSGHVTGVEREDQRGGVCTCWCLTPTGREEAARQMGALVGFLRGASAREPASGEQAPALQMSLFDPQEEPMPIRERAKGAVR